MYSRWFGQEGHFHTLSAFFYSQLLADFARNVTANVSFATRTLDRAHWYEFVMNVTTDHTRGGALFAEGLV